MLTAVSSMGDSARDTLIGHATSALSFEITPSGTLALNTQVGTTATDTLSVRNETDSSMSLLLSLSGSSASLFSLSASSVTVAGDSTATVMLNFLPLLAGTDTAMLTVISGAGDTEHVTVIGHALARLPFVISPTGNLVFNTRVGVADTQMLTIRNPAATALALTLALTGSSDFSTNLTSITIASFDSVQVPIVFESNTAGTFNGRLTVRSLLGDTASVNLIGRAILATALQIVMPNEVDFTTKAGESECMPIPIQNNTGDTVSISELRLRGDQADFSLTTTGTLEIAANSSDTVEVCFNPTFERGVQNATLNFRYASLTDSRVKGNENVHLMGFVEGRPNAGDSTFFLTTENIDFDNILAGTMDCKSVRISNPTSSAVTIDSAFVTGPDASDFTVSGDSMLLVSANSVAYLDLCYSPLVAMSEQTDTLTLMTTSGTLSSSITIRIEANAIDSLNNNGELSNCIYVSHEKGVLGPIVMGGSDTSAIFLTNRTTGTVTITNSSISGSGSSSFSVVSTLPMTIDSGAQGQLMVAFNPPTTGGPSFGANIALTTNGTGMTCGPIMVHVEGVAVPGFLNKDRDTSDIDLGRGETGNGTNVIGILNHSGNKCLADTITLVNTTSASITIEQILIPAGHFSLISTSMALPATLTAGSSLTAVVEFCDDPTPNVFTAPMYVATSQSIQPQTYQLQAIQAAPSSVAEAPDPLIGFSISPNPSGGEVTLDITGAQKVQAQVYDLLGSLVTTLHGTSQIVWNGRDASGTPLASGAYIVRVTGTDVNGQPFLTSKEMVIQR